MIALETRLMHSMNEDHQTTAIRLQEINDLVVVARDGQQKVWGAIKRISKDLQEMIQRDASTDGEDEADLAPATTNLDVAVSAPIETVPLGTSWSWLKGIPEEEESSIKDPITSRLPSKRPSVGGEASGSGGQPMLLGMEESKVYSHEVKTL